MKTVTRNFFEYAWILLIIMLCGCQNKSEDSGNLRSVLLTAPLSTSDKEIKEYSGVIEEGKSVSASFMADGKISHIYVKEGDRVGKGRLIASLDDTDYQIGVNQLKAQFNQMTEEKKRMDEMFRRHNIAPNDYEKFTTGYEQLKLQLEMAENKLGYTKLYAPSDGYVAEKFMEPGELVGAGTPIVKIIDDSKLMANVDLPVSIFIDRDKISSASGFSPALPDSEIPLTIESFTPDAGNNMLYHMKLLIPSKYAASLSPGMNIRVRIATECRNEEGWLVPSRSVFEENGKRFVWVYLAVDSTIHKKEVVVEGTPSGRYITVAGLHGSEQIVETGVKQLYEGEKVHVSDIADFGL